MSIFLNRKTVIVLQLLVSYIVWPTSAFGKSVSMPELEPPSNIQEFGKSVFHYNVNPAGRQDSMDSLAAFHNDVILPPHIPHFPLPAMHGGVPPSNVYTMDPVLAMPNPGDVHHDLKNDVSTLKDHLIMLAESQRTLLDHLKIPQKPLLPQYQAENQASPHQYHDNVQPSSANNNYINQQYNNNKVNSGNQQESPLPYHDSNVLQPPNNNYGPNYNQQYNNNKMNYGIQESAGIPAPYFPPMPPPPAPALPDLPYGNDNYHKSGSAYTPKTTTDASNYHHHHHHSTHHQQHHHHHRHPNHHSGHYHHHHHGNKYGGHATNGTGIPKRIGRLGRLIDRRRRIRQRRLNRLSRTFSRGLNRAFGGTTADQQVTERTATQTLTFIKDGVVNALWTALIVAAVKLVPLIFLAVKLMFKSVIPLAGFAAFGGSGSGALSLFGGTANDDATPAALTDDDFDDDKYDYDDRAGSKRKRGGRRRHGIAKTKTKEKRLIDDAHFDEFDEDLDDAADMVDDDDRSLEDDFEHEDQLDDDDFDEDDMDDDELDGADKHSRPTPRHHHSHRRRT